MERAWFDRQMARLAGLPYPPPNGETHWEALQDMPEVLLEAAVTKAQQESGEFPSPKMLRVYADYLRSRIIPVGPEPDRSTPMDPLAVTLPTGKVIPFTREWKYYCTDCHDTGWRSWACGRAARDRQPWLEVMDCGRDHEHDSHEWSERCPCADHNPAVLRKRERDLQMASQRVKSRGDAA